MVRGSGEKVMGIDSPYGGLLACANAVGLSLEIGELLGDKIQGSQIGLILRPKLILWRIRAFEV